MPDPFDPWIFLLPVRSPPGVDVPPPTSVSNCVRLRPFSGKSTTSAEFTTCAMPLSLVSTIDALAATSTVSLTAPTVMVMFIEIVRPTSSTIPVCRYSLNPGAFTSRMYPPGGRLGIAKWPCASLMVECATWVSAWIMVTGILTITFPEESITVPSTSATATACPCARGATSARKPAKNTLRRST